MATIVGRAAEALRITWAIAAKDIVDALKNRTILSTLIAAVVLMAMYKGMPALSRASDVDLFVYDAGGSSLLTELENSSRFRVRQVSSLSRLLEVTGMADAGEIGLAIRPDFDRILQSGSQPEIAGYLPWASRSTAAALAARYEERFSELLGRPVRIQIEGHIVYPQPQVGGAVRTISAAVAVVMLYLGAMLVPQLLLEEKRARTMAALLISPASVRQVVAGKALAGLFYALVGGGAMLALNLPYVVHWGLAIAAVALGALLAVAIGLFLGSLFEMPQQMTPWMLLVMNILLVPPFLLVAEDILPPALAKVFYGLPSVAAAMLLRFSFSNPLPAGEVALNSALIAGSVALFLALTGWRLGQWDR